MDELIFEKDDFNYESRKEREDWDAKKGKEQLVAAGKLFATWQWEGRHEWQRWCDNRPVTQAHRRKLACLRMRTVQLEQKHLVKSCALCKSKHERICLCREELELQCQQFGEEWKARELDRTKLRKASDAQFQQVAAFNKKLD